MRPVLVTITGPSASGKTVLAELLKKEGLEPLISTTTRAMRNGEKQDIHYHFVSKERFDTMAANNELIEHVEYDGQQYGISAQEALRAFGIDKPAVLVAEPEGVKQIHAYAAKRGWDVVRVFVMNPSQVLLERLLQRFSQDMQVLTTPEEQAACVARHAQRIDKVINFEQKNWVIPALSGEAHYDLLFQSFTSATQHEVMTRITDHVQKLLEKHDNEQELRRKAGPR